MRAASGNDAPLLVNEIIDAQASQQNASVNAQNTITFTIATRASLAPGALVQLLGLNGSSTPTSDSLAITGNGTSVFGNTSSWINTNSETSVTLLVSAASSPEEYYTVSFQLNNSAAWQQAPRLSARILAAGGGVEVMEVPVRSGLGNMAPFLLAAFVTNDISQSSSAAGGYSPSLPTPFSLPPSLLVFSLSIFLLPPSLPLSADTPLSLSHTISLALSLSRTRVRARSLSFPFLSFASLSSVPPSFRPSLRLPSSLPPSADDRSNITITFKTNADLQFSHYPPTVLHLTGLAAARTSAGGVCACICERCFVLKDRAAMCFCACVRLCVFV